MWSKWENKSESYNRCIDTKETNPYVTAKRRVNIQEIWSKSKREIMAHNLCHMVLATDQNEKAKVKQNRLTSGEWEERKLLDKEKRN